MNTEHYISLRLIHQEANNNVNHWILFAGPFLVLVVVAYCYMHTCLNNQSMWQIWPLPTSDQNQVIYILAIGSIGIMGLMGNLTEGWKKDQIWYFYAGLCLLFAFYFPTLENNLKCRLFLAALFMLGVAGLAVWIFHQTPGKENDVKAFLHKTFIGAVAAWAILYALMSWNQFFKIFCDCKGVRMWAILFFIVAILAFLGIGYFFHTKEKSIMNLIGYLAAGVALIILLIIQARDNASSSLASLLFD